MAFRTKNAAERNAHSYEGATIFWRPLLYAEQIEIRHTATVRGETNDDLMHLLAAQAAIEGWDDQCLSPDNQPWPVPGGADEERRAAIARIVEGFPGTLILQISVLARADDPETARKNLPFLFPANLSLPSTPPDGNLPAGIAEPSGGATGSLSPVTTGG